MWGHMNGCLCLRRFGTWCAFSERLQKSRDSGRAQYEPSQITRPKHLAFSSNSPHLGREMHCFTLNVCLFNKMFLRKYTNNWLCLLYYTKRLVRYKDWTQSVNFYIFNFYLLYFNYFQIYFNWSSILMFYYFKMQVAEYWNVFGNTPGKCCRVFEIIHFEKNIYEKHVLNSRLFVGNY